MSHTHRRSRRAALASCAVVAVLATIAATTPLPAQGGTPRLLRPADVDALPVTRAAVRHTYGPDSLQFGELRLPDGVGPFPVAVVLHGGCWYGPYAAVRNAAPLADALTDAGIATWNVEYRRYDHPGGGWPGTFRDVADALDHVRVLARTQPLDTTRLVTVGHSAGGHLAAWLATRDALDASSALRTASAPLRPSGVVTLGGILDLREYQARQRATCGNPAVESLLGGMPDAVPARVAEASPIERLPLGVPHAHVAGALDRIAPASERERFAQIARARGDLVEVITVPDLGHHDVMAPTTTAGEAAIAAVRRLLGLTPSPGRP
jgi:acetyl esterase/lipase